MADDTSRSDATADKGRPTPKRGEKTARVNPFRRLGRFLREVVEQLRKVVYPTRRQLITYSIVVLIFVAVVMAYIGALDFLFGDLVRRAFGADS
ncbi:preprotein translocase subunit SecE [Glycomyces buryatensis]|uniref:Protein translocase subunit SecE n=1 Tax=Glycomyces buryatensis TaxID=2570927 RepID=A0A4S8PVT6_9ACTN|nr:preprotein translocase subunit SecE [Glycomyces buryatensis]THV35628.1 preprotein translocase subunit SecE [Glycomyces buryatensis]